GSREVCSISRTVTNTPLQALITLNDPVYQEAAFFLAKQMLESGKEDHEKSIAMGYEKALVKPIDLQNQKLLEELYRFSKDDFEANPDQMEEWLERAEDRDKTPEFAALVVVANALLNLDELLTKS
ncbi:MAG: DUF1553 domain-containing protein, partial [Cyclobacteriaceae bacterium]